MALGLGDIFTDWVMTSTLAFEPRILISGAKVVVGIDLLVALNTSGSLECSVTDLEAVSQGYLGRVTLLVLDRGGGEATSLSIHIREVIPGDGV